jgi:hypothetical protein
VATHRPIAARAKPTPSLQRLSAEAEKAAAGAAAAKQLVRAAKAELKKARKQSKTAKKAAKLALKKVEAANAASATAKRKSPGARRVSSTADKPRTQKSPSAAEVAKVVISRMAAVSRGAKSGDRPAAAGQATEGPVAMSATAPPAPARDAFAARGSADASVAMGSGA